MFCPVLSCPVLFCPRLYCLVLFCAVPFCSVPFSSVLCISVETRGHALSFTIQTFQLHSLLFQFVSAVQFQIPCCLHSCLDLSVSVCWSVSISDTWFQILSWYIIVSESSSIPLFNFILFCYFQILLRLYSCPKPSVLVSVVQLPFLLFNSDTVLLTVVQTFQFQLLLFHFQFLLFICGNCPSYQVF